MKCLLMAASFLWLNNLFLSLILKQEPVVSSSVPVNGLMVCLVVHRIRTGLTEKI